jgi:hypothetical protein
MEENAVVKPLFKVEGEVAAPPLVKVKEDVAAQPLLAGVIYGEIVFWMMLVGIVIAVAGLTIYIVYGGYFNSANLLDLLWRGSDSLTIWQEVGNVSQPLPWYSCLKMLSKGDMLAVLGLAVAGTAAVFGTWGAFLGMLRTSSKIYMLFTLVIAVILTLSAVGILKLHM